MTQTPHHSSVVIGAGYAGVMAALRIARAGLSVTLINPRSTFVERIRHHEWAAGASPPSLELAQLFEGLPISVRVGRVVALVRNERSVVLDDGARLAFEQLVLATGSRARRSVPGAKEHAWAIAEAHDVPAIARFCAEAAPGGRLVVVGTGLTGLESATDLAEAYPNLEITLVGRDPVPRGLSGRGARAVARALRRANIRTVTGAVARVEAHAVVLESDEVVPFDGCVWAAAFEPSPLPRLLGLATHDSGQARIDAALRSTSHPAVFVVGDAAQFIDERGCVEPMTCQLAMPMGAHAGDNLVRVARGQTPQPFRFRPMARCISLGRRAGLVQLLRRDGSPGLAVTGRLGAWMKEMVCAYTIRSMHRERAGRAYRWPQGGPRALELAEVAQPARPEGAPDAHHA